MRLSNLLTAEKVRMAILVVSPVLVATATWGLGPFNAVLLAAGAAAVLRLDAELAVTVRHGNRVAEQADGRVRALEEGEKGLEQAHAVTRKELMDAIGVAGPGGVLSLTEQQRLVELLTERVDALESQFAWQRSSDGDDESTDLATRLATLERSTEGVRKQLEVLQGSLGHLRRSLSTTNERAGDVPTQPPVGGSPTE